MAGTNGQGEGLVNSTSEWELSSEKQDENLEEREWVLGKFFTIRVARSSRCSSNDLL